MTLVSSELNDRSNDPQGQVNEMIGQMSLTILNALCRQTYI